MKTIVELYEDSNTDEVVSKYARMNYLDEEDLKQEVFLHILSEYDDSFELDKYVKKIAMRLKRSEQSERNNSLPFDERFIDYDPSEQTESWNYFFGDDDDADLPSGGATDWYWRGCSAEMNNPNYREESYSKSFVERHKKEKGLA